MDEVETAKEDASPNVSRFLAMQIRFEIRNPVARKIVQCH